MCTDGFNCPPTLHQHMPVSGHGYDCYPTTEPHAVRTQDKWHKSVLTIFCSRLLLVTMPEQLYTKEVTLTTLPHLPNIQEAICQLIDWPMSRCHERMPWCNDMSLVGADGLKLGMKQKIL